MAKDQIEQEVQNFEQEVQNFIRGYYATPLKDHQSFICKIIDSFWDYFKSTSDNKNIHFGEKNFLLAMTCCIGLLLDYYVEASEEDTDIIIDKFYDGLHKVHMLRRLVAAVGDGRDLIECVACTFKIENENDICKDVTQEEFEDRCSLIRECIENIVIRATNLINKTTN